MKLTSSLMIASAALVLVACADQSVQEDTATGTASTAAAPAPAPAPEAAPALPECDANGRDVLFDVDSAAFNDISLAVAQDLADLYFECEASSTTLIGATSTTGSEAHNQALSEQRAEAVAGVFRGAGVPNGSITTEGRGENFLKINTGDEVENVLNRRVAVEYDN
jgi:outer membrane protein OmpA-like peptidoglycan-associated protein